MPENIHPGPIYPPRQVFRQQFARFRELLEEHPESTGPFRDFESGLIHEMEGYKKVLWNEGRRRLGAEHWLESSAGSGKILDSIVSAIEINTEIEDREVRNNLVHWEGRYGEVSRSHHRLLELRDHGDEVLREVESTFFRLYRGPDPGHEVFDALVSRLGRRFDLLAYLFFLEDDSRFAPISPKAFERAFELLEIPQKLSGRCSWQNYEAYLARLYGIKELIRNQGLPEAGLLDAHTFCFTLASFSPRGDGAGLDELGSAAWELAQQIAHFSYRHDLRRYPDVRRRGRFRSGWLDATVHDKSYAEKTLESLTWTNLGYRLGQIRGGSDADEIDQVFDLAERVYRAKKLHLVMEDLAHRIYREAGYRPARYRQELRENGGLRYARRILASRSAVTPDFKRLTGLGRADLTVETLVLDERFRDLFSAEERYVAHSRLEALSGTAFPENASTGEDSEPTEFTELVEDSAHGSVRSPERSDSEVQPPEYREGEAGQVTTNRYERDPRARAACLEHFGFRCQVCDLDFAQRYGSIGEGFIHVHHRFPLSQRTGSYKVDPLKDMVPVCPNCHAMLHKKNPPWEVDELRAQLRD